MTYKTFLIGFSIIVSIFILCSSIIYIPIISDIIVNSEKTIQIRILKLISLINIIYHLASVLKLNKLINIILIIIVLSIIEFITLKDYHIKRTKSITQQDKQLGWTWIPNSSKISHINGKEVKVRFNSQGLRGSEESLKNKILFLGNSVTQGQSVQEKETFSYILNGINGGFDGYDTYMQRDRFKRDLHNLQIDKLILVSNSLNLL